jgi:pimeloyl-ACP methyl ester carboxylesterase
MGGLVSLKTAEGAAKIKALVLIASAPPKGIKLEFKKDFMLVKIMLRGIWFTIRKKPLLPNYAITVKLALNNIEPKDQMTVYKMLGPESMAVGNQVGKGYPIDVDKIRCPKLVIGCKRDNIAIESMEEKFARLIKADKYIAYKQFGHMIMIEKGWEKSAEDIKNWLISAVKN